VGSTEFHRKRECGLILFFLFYLLLSFFSILFSFSLFLSILFQLKLNFKYKFKITRLNAQTIKLQYDVWLIYLFFYWIFYPRSYG
jgi:hypothetical protein